MGKGRLWQVSKTCQVAPRKDWEGPAAPKAFLNYLLFDRNFTLIGYGADQISYEANEDGSDIPHDMMYLEVDVKEPGYLYTYISNENDKLVDVYFDDFMVTYKPGEIVQEGHYYPYGNEIASLSYRRENTMANNYRYQADFSEKDDLTGLNSFYLRSYDSQLGRWTASDPYNQFASGYVVMGNSPVMYVDPDGGFSWVGAAVGAVLGGTSAYFASDGDLKWTITGIFGGAIAGGFLGDLGDAPPGQVNEGKASFWEKLRAGLGEGELTNSGRYKVGRSSGSLNFPKFLEWQEATFSLAKEMKPIFDISKTYGLNFTINSNVKKLQFEFSDRWGSAEQSITRDNVTIWNVNDDLVRLNSPVFSQRGNYEINHTQHFVKRPPAFSETIILEDGSKYTVISDVVATPILDIKLIVRRLFKGRRGKTLNYGWERISRIK